MAEEPPLQLPLGSEPDLLETGDEPQPPEMPSMVVQAAPSTFHEQVGVHRITHHSNILMLFPVHKDFHPILVHAKSRHEYSGLKV
jgi:hypothetical protein